MEGPSIHAKGHRNESKVYASETKVEAAGGSKNVSSYLFTKNILCFQSRKWFSVVDNMLYVHEAALSPRKIPFIECDLRLCDFGVIEARNRFTISPPALRTITFTARNRLEWQQWVRVLEDVIHSRPGKRRVPTGVARMVFMNPRCADCRAPCPYFLVLNLGILVCKQCATIHRTLGRHWKVRSLPASPELWRASWAALVADIGNKASNSIWEADMGECNKPQPSATLEAKQCWIYAKYLSRSFIGRHLLLDPKDPSERLFEAACRGCAKGIVTHFAAGANMKWIDQRGNTALHVVACNSSRACLRLLLTHNADVWARNNEGLTARDMAPNQSVLDMIANAEQLRPRMERVRFVHGYNHAAAAAAADAGAVLSAASAACIYAGEGAGGAADPGGGYALTAEGVAAAAVASAYVADSVDDDDDSDSDGGPDSDSDAEVGHDRDGAGVSGGGNGGGGGDGGGGDSVSVSGGGGGGGNGGGGDGKTKVDPGTAAVRAVAATRPQHRAVKATSYALLGPATRVVVKARGRA